MLRDLTRRLQLIRDDTTDEVGRRTPEGRHQVVQLLLRATTGIVKTQEQYAGLGQGTGTGWVEVLYPGKGQSCREEGREGVINLQEPIALLHLSGSPTYKERGVKVPTRFRSRDFIF